MFCIQFLTHQLLKRNHINNFYRKLQFLKLVTQNGKRVPPHQFKKVLPNQQAIHLLTGFASGNVTMSGDKVKHLPTVSGESSISDSLQELPRESPSPDKKKKTDGSAMRNTKPKIAQKEPRKTHAKYLAELNPRTKVPDSEICLEKIIQGSPTYIPHKRIPKSNQGCGKFSKKITFPTSSSLEMLVRSVH